MRTQPPLILGLFTCLATVASCGGVKEEDPCLAANPDEALGCLGVPPDDSDRADSQGGSLPATYSPLGPTKKLGVSSEFALIGMRLAPPVPVGDPVVLDESAAIVEFASDDTAEIGPGVLEVMTPAASWEIDSHTPHIGLGPSNSGAVSIRAAASADLDGDGTDELVVVYLDFDDAANKDVIFAEVVGGATSVVGTFPDARDVAAEAGDFDGDGTVELAVGVSSNAAASVFVLETDAAGDLVVANGSTKDFASELGNSEISIELATGNLDRDGGDELAVVINEFVSRTSATTRYALFDDASAGFADLRRDGEVRVRDEGSFTAVVADVTIGDIDADGKGEVLFAGLEELHDQSCQQYRHIYLALDDAGDSDAPLEVIGERAEEIRYLPSSGCSEVSNNLPMRHVFINALDIDNDGVAEIQANLRVFEDFRVGAFTEAFALDPTVLAGPDGRGGGAFTTSTADMKTADINGDGREDIVAFAQFRDEVVVWGLDGPAPSSAVFRQMTQLPTLNYNGQTRVFPIVLPTNVDSDGAVLKYSDAEYKFVFTEPIIIAAVAAAPCADGVGQNLEACSTSYGLSEATTGGVDASVTVSASAFVSFEAKDPFFGIGVEGKETVTASASFSASRSYSLEESVEYTTGALEDTVIFTTLPVDQYSYTVVAHPDPEMVGETIVVNLPRRPITLQVERDFYNRSVAPGSTLIDASVFDHVVGDIDSYPSEAEARAAVEGGRGLAASSAVSVGQGGGSTTTELVFTESTEYRAGAEISYEREIAVTGGGVGVGGSIGGSVGAGLSWGTTTSTVYRGSIGSIDAANFADNLYSAGLYTYIHNHGDSSAPQFEVINYWVER